MPIDVTTEVVIDRPVAEVAAYAADPTNVPAWYDRISSVAWQTPPPVAVGTRVAFVASFLGKRLSYTYEVVELDLPHRLVMRTDDGPFPMETTYEWAAEGDRTRMRLRNRGEPPGVLGKVDAVVAAQVRRSTTKDLAKLAALLRR